MLFFASQQTLERDALLAAVKGTQGVVEFDINGIYLEANETFLKIMGYDAAELAGKHHSHFVPKTMRESAAYTAFWERLRKGIAETARFKRITKSGREIWLQGSYCPIRGRSGAVVKVVKFALDVTDQVTELADLRGQAAAIDRVQGTIEFDLDGTVRTANKNFLDLLGYRLEEVKGKPHRLFVAPDYAASEDYRRFWRELAEGTFHSGQYRRIGKGGKVVWIEASYNPIFDADGTAYKVIKFATDITEQVDHLDDLKTMIDVNFGEIDTGLEQTRREATGVTRATDDASSNVNMVAAASEELAASIAEISASMANSRQAADGVSERAGEASGAASRLSEAAAAMGGIVGLIQNIAGQINLLALNATIESARAGDAGKGFAVVANEVKNLANQAAKATEEITQEIARVQTVSDDVVGSLTAIREAVTQVHEYVTTTASAVEEQSAVTRDMSANMQSAASSVSGIADNVRGIMTAVSDAESAMSRTRTAAEVLVRQV